jgi:hypothetical protein
MDQHAHATLQPSWRGRHTTCGSHHHDLFLVRTSSTISSNPLITRTPFCCSASSPSEARCAPSDHSPGRRSNLASKPAAMAPS